MSTLRAKLPHNPAVGLTIGEREVFLSRVALTSFGPAEVGRHREPIADGGLEAAIRRALATRPDRKPWRSAPVAVGLPTLSVFFSTRPLKTIDRDASPQVLLHEVLQSSSLIIDDMEVDMIQLQPGKTPVASIAACRKKQMAPVLAALEACGVRPFRVEPNPCGLLRAAVARQRTPKRARTAVRIFVGEHSGLAILAGADAPLMWRYFALEPGDEAGSLLSVARAIQHLGRYCGVDEAPGAVLIHGRPDLTGLADPAAWSWCPVRPLRLDGPGFDLADVAYGLALGCQPGVAAFNLARSSQPPEPWTRLVPWGQLAFQGAALAGATLLLTSVLGDHEAAGRAVEAERAKIGWLKGQSAAELAKEKKELTARLESIGDYVGGRMLWTGCAREVAAHLPDDMVVTAFEGKCELPPDGGRSATRPRTSLSVTIEAPIAEGGAVPASVDGLVGALRSSETFRRALPDVQMGPLRWSAGGQGRAPRASFTVLCRPKDEGKKPRARNH